MFESLLLIVVVVEAVWILSSIFRGAEEERKVIRPGGPRPNSASIGSRGPQRPPATAVDRFLEEINRRRREAAQKPGPTPQRPEPVRLERPRPAEPARRVNRPVPPATRAASSSRTGPVVVREAAIVVPPTSPAPAKPTSRLQSKPAPEVVVAAEVIAPAEAAVARPVVTNSKPESPLSAERLTVFLRDRQNLQAAFVLNEVLGAPLCQRTG